MFTARSSSLSLASLHLPTAVFTCIVRRTGRKEKASERIYLLVIVVSGDGGGWGSGSVGGDGGSGGGAR